MVKLIDLGRPEGEVKLVDVEKYTRAELRSNSRLGLCRRCFGGIFYLACDVPPRDWWHESPELDNDHMAEPQESQLEREY